MPILHSPGVITPGQFGPIEPALRRADVALHLDHVEHRHALGDADDELDPGGDRLHNRVGRERRRHVDYAGVGAGRFARPARRCRKSESLRSRCRPCPEPRRRPSGCRILCRRAYGICPVAPVIPWVRTRVFLLTRILIDCLFDDLMAPLQSEMHASPRYSSLSPTSGSLRRPGGRRRPCRPRRSPRSPNP